MTAISSIIILILCLAVLPAIFPAAYATLAAIVLFILFMSAGGYYISKNNIRT
ncbi:putative membrane protein [Methanomicrobium sp. W14]|nr:putative membrane protein [Methanomicrobium sp. W14]